MSQNLAPTKLPGLQLPMKQDVAHSNMLILAQFHTNFLMQHLKWIQEEDEVLANTPALHCR
jgi:hypothetical protein